MLLLIRGLRMICWRLVHVSIGLSIGILAGRIFCVSVRRYRGLF